ncbi:MAG: hypothetical protein KDB07_10005 [Planctomycetes bacterium]|nr:hypothetical protein [Planctomycetota bacterium]
MFSLIWKVLWNVSIIVGVVAPIALCFLLITRKAQVEAWWNGADAYSKYADGEAKEKIKARLGQLIEEAKVEGERAELPKSEREEDHFISTEGVTQ